MYLIYMLSANECSLPDETVPPHIYIHIGIYIYTRRSVPFAIPYNFLAHYEFSSDWHI